MSNPTAFASVDYTKPRIYIHISYNSTSENMEYTVMLFEGNCNDSTCVYSRLVQKDQIPDKVAKAGALRPTAIVHDSITKTAIPFIDWMIEQRINQ